MKDQMQNLPTEEKKMETQKRKMFPCGQLFKEAVLAFRVTDQQVRCLDSARRSLYRAGFSKLAIPVTKELRRRLFELSEERAANERNEEAIVSGEARYRQSVLGDEA